MNRWCTICQAEFSQAEFGKHMASHRTRRPTSVRQAQLKRRPACERCRSRTDLDVHHRDGDPTNNAPQNLETLCNDCHVEEEARRRAAGRPDPRETARGRSNA